MDDSAITALDYKRVRRRFLRPLQTASGGYATRESLVLRVTLADGRIGYAEHAPWPGFPVPSLEATESELRSVNEEVRNGRGEFTPHTSHFLIRAAADWATRDRGRSAVTLPCAALIRADAEAPDRVAAGYRTLKRKIGVAAVRDEQRAVSALVRAAGAGVRLRLDANGTLSEKDTAYWCDFLSEFEEIEWLEQPMAPGAEAAMRAIAERAGVAERLALDESVCTPDGLPDDWPGILAVKPVLLGDLDSWRARRHAYARVAYASAFETPFGRQAALGLAAEYAGESPRAVGFGTLGAFDDDLDIHAPGPLAATVAADWESLWEKLGEFSSAE